MFWDVFFKKKADDDESDVGFISSFTMMQQAVDGKDSGFVQQIHRISRKLKQTIDEHNLLVEKHNDLKRRFEKLRTLHNTSAAAAAKNLSDTESRLEVALQRMVEQNQQLANDLDVLRDECANSGIKITLPK